MVRFEDILSWKDGGLEDWRTDCAGGKRQSNKFWRGLKHKYLKFLKSTLFRRCASDDEDSWTGCVESWTWGALRIVGGGRELIHIERTGNRRTYAIGKICINSLIVMIQVVLKHEHNLMTKHHDCRVNRARTSNNYGVFSAALDMKDAGASYGPWKLPRGSFRLADWVGPTNVEDVRRVTEKMVEKLRQGTWTGSSIRVLCPEDMTVGVRAPERIETWWYSPINNVSRRMLRILNRTSRASILVLVGVRFGMIINTWLCCRWSRTILYQHVSLCEVVKLRGCQEPSQVLSTIQSNSCCKFDSNLKGQERCTFRPRYNIWAWIATALKSWARVSIACERRQKSLICVGTLLMLFL
jgi:hypothetical protein